MTRWAFVSDVHIGNHKRFGGPIHAGINTRCRLTLDVLEHALDVAKQRSCEKFVIAGDLFDTSSPSPQILTAVMLLFDRYNAYERITVIAGNHDLVSSDPGDSALGPINWTVDVITGSVVEDGGLYIPFRTGNAEAWLPDAVSDAIETVEKGAYRIPLVMVIHLGIRDAETAPFLKSCPDSIDIDTLQRVSFEHDAIELIVAGNWHQRRQWCLTRRDGKAVPVAQLGTLCPTGFRDLGTEDVGWMLLWDDESESISWVQIPGPRFVKVHSVGALRELVESLPDSTMRTLECYFIQAILPADEAEAAKELEFHDRLLPGDVLEIVEDDTDIKAAASTAASVARSSESIDEAIHAYIEQFPVPAPGTKDGVRERMTKYRKASSV